MRETIGVGSRVAARRGPLEDQKPGKVRQQRALKFGRVAEPVGFNEWHVLWNDGAASTEKSKCLKLQPNNAALFPQVCTPNQFHPVGYQNHAFVSLFCDFHRQSCGVWVGLVVFRRGGETQFFTVFETKFKIHAAGR
jgi:hypothetical protein